MHGETGPRLRAARGGTCAEKALYRRTDSLSLTRVDRWRKAAPIMCPCATNPTSAQRRGRGASGAPANWLCRRAKQGSDERSSANPRIHSKAGRERNAVDRSHYIESPGSVERRMAWAQIPRSAQFSARHDAGEPSDSESSSVGGAPSRSEHTVGGANGMGAAVLRHTSRKKSFTERARRLGEDVGALGPAALVTGLRRSSCPKLK